MKQHGLPLKIKKLTDKVVAGTLLLGTAPVVAAAALAVRVTMGAPAFFRQTRPGRDGVPFTIYKLRTMLDTRDHRGENLDDAVRLTRVGRLLRELSIDELPQLWNVLNGSLSLVGPRPLLMEYLPLYSEKQRRRHEVLPGITGWAQIHGRNSISWDEKFELDVWYVDNWSLGLDLQILVQTVWSLVHRSGIASEGHATMPKFEGA